LMALETPTQICEVQTSNQPVPLKTACQALGVHVYRTHSSSRWCGGFIICCVLRM
jgi:hypothetical protein